MSNTTKEFTKKITEEIKEICRGLMFGETKDPIFSFMKNNYDLRQYILQFFDDPPTGPTDEEKEFARFHGWNGKLYGVCEDCGRKNTCLLEEYEEDEDEEDEEDEDEKSVNPLVCLKCLYGEDDEVKCQECFEGFSQFDNRIMLPPYYGYICKECGNEGAEWCEFYGKVIYR